MLKLTRKIILIRSKSPTPELPKKVMKPRKYGRYQRNCGKKMCRKPNSCNKNCGKIRCSKRQDARDPSTYYYTTELNYKLWADPVMRKKLLRNRGWCAPEKQIEKTRKRLEGLKRYRAKVKAGLIIPKNKPGRKKALLEADTFCPFNKVDGVRTVTVEKERYNTCSGVFIEAGSSNG